MTPLLQQGEELIATALGTYGFPLRSGTLGFLADVFRPNDPTEIRDAIVVTGTRVLVVRLASFRSRVVRVHAEESRKMVVPVAFDEDPREPGVELRFPNGRIVRITGERGQLESYKHIGELLGATDGSRTLPATTITPGERKRTLSRATFLLGTMWLGWLALLVPGWVPWRNVEMKVMLTGLLLMTGLHLYVLLTLDKKRDGTRSKS